MIAAYAAASLLPLPLIVAAGLRGGSWGLVALFSITGLAALLDQGVPAPFRPDGRARTAQANALSALLAIAHLLMIPFSVWAVAGASGLAGWQRAVLLLAAAYCLGQIGNANAHELIHRPGRLLNGLGKSFYIALLFGHHASAHPGVHHVHVATAKDPNSARRGESLYHFLPRAWGGSFRAGLALENRRLRGAGRPSWHLANPYWRYALGAFAALGLSALIAGLSGILAHLALAAIAQVQLLSSDYVQHYGLRRRLLPEGRPEPVGTRHSWNAPQWFSGLMMLAAPRHSDHHAHPGKPYPALTIPEGAPLLPLSLPLMVTLALWPKGWRRVMDPRVTHARPHR